MLRELTVRVDPTPMFVDQEWRIAEYTVATHVVYVETDRRTASRLVGHAGVRVEPTTAGDMLVTVDGARTAPDLADAFQSITDYLAEVVGDREDLPTVLAAVIDAWDAPQPEEIARLVAPRA